MLPLNATGLNGLESGKGVKSSGSTSSRRIPNKLLLFAKRVFRFSQMDFEVALTQMLYMLISPKRAYRDISYHKQTKNQWARDDPAFVVILSLVLTVCAVLYGFVYMQGFLGILKLVVHMVLVDFILVGVAVATLTWFLTNKLLRVETGHFIEQSVEWGYSFDVHCNSFVPIVVILYVIQFFFIPVITKDNFLSMFIGNSMYFAAFVYYHYITFLGYTALPFLQHTEVFLYPIGIYGILYILSLFFFNISSFSLSLYFPQSQ